MMRVTQRVDARTLSVVEVMMERSSASCLALWHTIADV